MKNKKGAVRVFAVLFAAVFIALQIPITVLAGEALPDGSVTSGAGAVVQTVQEQTEGTDEADSSVPNESGEVSEFDKKTLEETPQPLENGSSEDVLVEGDASHVDDGGEDKAEMPDSSSGADDSLVNSDSSILVDDSDVSFGENSDENNAAGDAGTDAGDDVVKDGLEENPQSDFAEGSGDDLEKTAEDAAEGENRETSENKETAEAQTAAVDESEKNESKTGESETDESGKLTTFMMSAMSFAGIDPFSVITSPGDIQDIFPDPVLAQYMAGLFGTDIHAAVNQNKLNAITQINPSGAVHSVEGLQYLNGLKEARIDNLQITQRIPEGFISDVYPGLNFYVANNQRYQSETIYLTSLSLAEVIPYIPPVFLQIAQNSGGAVVGSWNIKNGNGGTIASLPAINGNELLGYNLPSGGSFIVELVLNSGVWMGLDGSIYIFPVVLDVNTTGVVNGTVTAAGGGALAGVAVTLKNSSGAVVATTQTNANGFYLFNEVPPGNYSVTADYNGYYSQTKSAVAVAGGTTTVNFGLEQYSGSVVGTVLDAVTLKPVSGALVNPQIAGVTSKTTGADGKFYYSYVPAGSHTAIVSKTGYQTKTDTQNIQGNMTTEVTIYLDPVLYVLDGYVYDIDSGAAVPGASINLPGVGSTTTNASGYYKISGIYPGEYTATAQKTSYSTDSAKLNIAANTKQDFYLAQNPAELNVAAYNNSIGAGNGLNGVALTLTGTMSGGESLTLVANTAGGGLHSFFVPPGRYSITAEIEGYRQTSAPTFPVTVAAGQTLLLNFVFEEIIYTISGTVYDSSAGNAPIPGAEVSHAQTSGAATAYITDGAGGYSITPLGYGKHLLVASAAGYTSSAAVIDTAKVDSSGNIVKDFYLSTSVATLTGTVYFNGTTTPVPGAVFHLSDGRFDTADANGQAVANLAADTYTAYVEYNGYQTPPQTVTLAAGDNAELVFYVFSGTALTGYITDALTGQAVDGVTVTISGASDADTITGTTGIYAFNSPPAGTYAIMVEKEGYQSVTRTGVTVTDGQITVEDFVLVPRVGMVSGTVSYSDGTPFEGAVIKLDNGGEMQTDTNGYYAFYAEPGSYAVEMQAQAHQPQTKPADVAAGVMTVVDFVLETLPGTIQGTVTDENGSPIANVHIYARSYYDTSATVYSTYTDANGFYVLDSLLPDTYGVVASISGYGTQGKSGQLPSAGVLVEDFTMMKNPGMLEGTVILADSGLPAAGAVITINPGGISVIADENGFYQIPLTAGDYTLTVSFSGYETQLRSTTLQNGQTVVEDFSLLKQVAGSGEDGGGTDGNEGGNTSPAGSKNSPQTGDSNRAKIFIIILLFSVFVIVLAFVIMRIRKNGNK